MERFGGMAARTIPPVAGGIVGGIFGGPGGAYIGSIGRWWILASG